MECPDIVDAGALCTVGMDVSVVRSEVPTQKGVGMYTRGFIFAAASCVDVYGDNDKLIGSLMADMATEDQRWFVVIHNWWGRKQLQNIDCKIAVTRYKHTHQYRLDPHFHAFGYGAYDDPEQALRDVNTEAKLYAAGGQHARIVE